MESDIDVLVVALDRLEEVSSVCAEDAFDIMLNQNESNISSPVSTVFGAKTRTSLESGEVSRELGRQFNKILETPNRARYDLHAEIGRNLAEETLQVAEGMIRELENRI